MISFHKILADGIFSLAALAVFGAFFGWMIGDIWLASSQWLQVASVLMLTSIYIKISQKEDEQLLAIQSKKWRSFFGGENSDKPNKLKSFRLN